MIRIGIVGYGNLAKGVEAAITQNPDMELVAVFTRRDPSGVQIRTPNVPVVSTEEALAWKDKIDVMLPTPRRPLSETAVTVPDAAVDAAVKAVPLREPMAPVRK